MTGTFEREGKFFCGEAAKKLTLFPKLNRHCDREERSGKQSFWNRNILHFLTKQH